MTRGKFVLITDETVYGSCEFNGDMYYDNGHGIEVVERLELVKGYEDFKKHVSDFDKNHFGYQDNYDGYFGVYNYEIYPYNINFNKDYFGEWFSDYLYILNLSSKQQPIKDRDDTTFVIEPGEIQIYHFGHYEGSSSRRYPNGMIICVSDDEAIAQKNSCVEENTEETQFEEVVFNSFTVDSNEILNLYKKGYITAIPPTDEEVYDAIHNLLGSL